jgi:ketosteroid isomerase-like protein
MLYKHVQWIHKGSAAFLNRLRYSSDGDPAGGEEMRIKWLWCFAFVTVFAIVGPPNVKAQQPATVETLKQFVSAFNAHDLDAVMKFFADDCELMMPRGPEPRGQRYVGKAEVRRGLASRFEGIPDVQYENDEHWVSGNHGVSTWTLTGTTREGKKINVRGCDLLEFKEGKIIRKDSYWKIVDPKS